MKLTKYVGAAVLTMGASLVSAQNIDVTITNLTQGIYYTPFVVAGHNDSTYIFRTGEAASAALQALAEGGDTSAVVANLDAAGAVVVNNPANGLLAPAASTSTSLDTGSNGYLSIAAMMLPTNDGFAGLNSWKIPTEPGTYTINLNAYDAGTEANNELIVNGSGASGVLGIPAAPGGDTGTNGTGVTVTEGNQTVHIHRGSLGDDDLAAGKSDLDNRVHRWLNPVVRVTVVVN
ncbi:spondin domain-containing protein [Pleionea sp. CnH1-48]|uniref:spondin domain-containing protein n=1 Tax=Pleionea sp. CnH1-48 TaxID=2954494 RepID=UPI002097B2B7|nr:spondin domain-containing protein [Pleionea sp. CnH1-48]MCO7226888.1 spondin domain-containing protein [Pleionea sp. CnH1-48]